MTDQTASVTTLVAVCGGTLLMAANRGLTRANFLIVLLTPNGSWGREQLPLLAFTLGLIAFLTEIIGLLYTVTALFYPQQL
jgi:hypothetical protein